MGWVAFARGSCGLVVAVTAGCQVVFDLDVPIDNVSLEVERVSIGTTVVSRPQDVADLQAHWLVPDDDAPDGLRRIEGIRASNASNRWTAELPGPAAVMYTPSDEPPRLLDLGASNVVDALIRIEHPDPEVADPTAELTIAVTLPTPLQLPDESISLFSVGGWFAATLGGVANATSVTHSFTMAEALRVSVLPPAWITPGDNTFILRHNGFTLTGGAELPFFDQQSLQSTTLDPVAMATLVRDQELDILLDASVVNRLGTVRPAPTGPSGMFWDLRAAPGHAVLDQNGPLLDSAVVPQSMPTVQATYGNPFQSRGWLSSFNLTAVRLRLFPADPPSVPLITGLVQRAVEPANGTRFDFEVPLPTEVSLDGTPLTEDGTQVLAPTRAVVVSFTTDREADALYGAELLELVMIENDRIVVPRLKAFALSPRFVFPPELFEAGKLYTIRATAETGFSAAAVGDLRPRLGPRSFAQVDGGVFEIVAQ